MTQKSMDAKLLAKNLRVFQFEGTLCDTVLQLSDGVVYAHSVVLVASVPNLKSYLFGIIKSETVQDENPLDNVKKHILVLPDFNCHDGRQFIDFAYACDDLNISPRILQVFEKAEDRSSSEQEIFKTSSECQLCVEQSIIEESDLPDIDDDFISESIVLGSTVEASQIQIKQEVQEMGSTETTHTCELCRQIFGRSVALKKHLSDHAKKMKTLKNVRGKSGMLVKKSQQIISNSTNTESVPPGGVECPVCYKKFKFRSKFMEHSRIHTGAKPYTCTNCEKGFAIKGNLRKHQLHCGASVCVCTFCMQSFQNLELLQQHSREHVGFACPYCSITLENYDELKQHDCLHISDPDHKIGSTITEIPTILLCSKCDARYYTPAELRSHMATEHKDKPCLDIQDNTAAKGVSSKKEVMGVSIDSSVNDVALDCEKQFECKLCSMKMFNLSCWKNHMRAHDANRNFSCATCGDKFKLQSGLVHHIQSKHKDQTIPAFKGKNDRPKKYGCVYCGKAFSRQEKLTMHERVHTGERPYKCDKCGAAYKQKNDLVRHSNKHNGIKPFTCSVCKKSFTAASYLVDHMRQHTDERPFGCTVCEMRFRTRGALVVHERQHTGAKPFMCDLCSRMFAQKANLLKHMQLHSEKRSHNCTLCNKGFTDSQGLKRHMNMHTGERPFVCSTCGRGFPSKGTLNIHIKFHDGVRSYSCEVCGKGFVVRSHLKRHQLTHIRNALRADNLSTDISSLQFYELNSSEIDANHFPSESNSVLKQSSRSKHRSKHRLKIGDQKPLKVEEDDDFFLEEEVVLTGD